MGELNLTHNMDTRGPETRIFNNNKVLESVGIK